MATDFSQGISLRDWGVKFQLEGAFGHNEPYLQKMEFIVTPSFTVDIFEDTELFASTRMRWDAVDNLEPGRPNQIEISEASKRLIIGNHGDVELRELYLTTALGDGLLITGKQSIVWGTADGLRVLDVVNPFSFREFILDDFEDSRIPIWSLNYSFPLQNSELQFLWLFDQTYNDFALLEKDSLFEVTSPRFIPSGSPPIPGITVIRDEIDKPSRFFLDSDIGMKFSSTIAGWDFTLNYLYHYSDNPVPVRSFTIKATGPELRFQEQYFRTHLIGGTFSTALGQFVLRGELGYSTDRYVLTNDPNDQDGIKKTGELSYVLGLDWSGLEDTFMSAQLFQSILTSDRESLVRDQIDSTVSFLYQRSFLNETVQFETIWLHNINDGDGMVRPKLSYNISDNVNTSVGLDVIYGNKQGVFGQYNNRDRLVFRIEWYF